MKLCATVVLPVYVEVEVPENATEEQKRAALLEAAHDVYESASLKARITECSDEALEDRELIQCTPPWIMQSRR